MHPRHLESSTLFVLKYNIPYYIARLEHFQHTEALEWDNVETSDQVASQYYYP